MRREYCHRGGRGATALAGLSALRFCSPMAAKRTPEALAAEARRRDRLAGALRENLKRRKAQARGRREEDKAEAPKEPDGHRED
jgi:hypothetical protein